MSPRRARPSVDSPFLLRRTMFFTQSLTFVSGKPAVRQLLCFPHGFASSEHQLKAAKRFSI